MLFTWLHSFSFVINLALIIALPFLMKEKLKMALLFDFILLLFLLRIVSYFFHTIEYHIASIYSEFFLLILNLFFILLFYLFYKYFVHEKKLGYSFLRKINFYTQTEKALEKVLENAPWAVLILKQNHVVWANKESQRLLRISSEETINSPIFKIINKADNMELFAMISGSKLDYSADIYLKQKDFTTPIHCDIQHFNLEKNEYTFCSFTDISEIKKSEQNNINYTANLKNAINESTKELKNKNEQLATANEELRANEEELYLKNKALSEQIELRIRFESEAHKNYENFEKLFQHIADPIYIHDLQGNILLVNHAAIEKIGYSLDEFAQMSVQDIASATSKNNIKIQVPKLIQNGSAIFESNQVTKSGSIITSEINAHIIDYNSTKVVISIARDITVRKKQLQELENYRNNLEKLVDERTKELQKAKEQAETADKLKMAFLANISHEIRTPMNAILGFSDLLTEKSLTNERKERYLKIISKSTEQMLNIISDILMVAELEANDAPLTHSDIRLSKIFEFIEKFAQEILKNQAKTKLVDFIWENKDATDKRIIKSDQDKILTILKQLVSNAIKFTNKGKIRISYELNQKKKICRLIVQDTGIGIPAEKLSYVFDAFGQAENKYEKKLSGTGLGLTIVRGYVELLGGTFNIDSEVLKGTKILIELPITTG